jgi:hypothetical protein
LLTLKRDRQLLLEAALGADGDDDSVEENDEIIEIDKQIQLMLQVCFLYFIQVVFKTCT